MNKDQVQGNWEELKGKVKQQWGKLTDDDITLFNGKRQEFAGKVQAAYGKTKEQVEQDIKAFEKSCGCSSSDNKAA